MDIQRLVPTTSGIAKVGDRYGRLVILGLFREDGQYPKYAFCQCDCGHEPHYAPLKGLRAGSSQSCGCLQKERTQTHGAWGTPLFNVWSGMISRCTNPADKRWARYGGRGIKICERWLDPHAFTEDMLPGYRKGLTIDRYPDNDGNYEPGNCRWATQQQQNRNYSRNRYLEHDGKRLLLVEWAELTGISMKRIHFRLKEGWSVHDALTKKALTTQERCDKARLIRWNKSP